MGFVVGSVPYVNAIPLTAIFDGVPSREGRGDSPVRVVFDIPSKLPQMLESGEADAVLVSSIDALRVPGRRMAAGVCIGSDGPVKSVRLFSRVPFKEIQSLALDAASLTSNRLARILLAELYGIHPSVVTLEPNVNHMLKQADACVLIGDIGMTSDGDGLDVMDMGEAWTRLTGKPFVWAAWIGNERLTPELAGHLQMPLEYYGSLALVESGVRRKSALPVEETIQSRRDHVIELGITHSGWTREMVQDYYDNAMVYDMDDRMLDGYREFQARLLRNGFDDCGHFPALVAPAYPLPI